MRNPENVLNSLREHSAQNNYSYDRLYRILYNQDFLLMAYQNIYANKGNMTAGVDGQTIDATEVYPILQTIVLNKYSHVMDFTKGLSETQLKLTTPKPVARYGMGDVDVKGLIQGCEKSVLGAVWNKHEYWLEPSLSDNHIVIVKKAVDKIIKEAFSNSGKISIGEIYDYLESTFGYSQSNLSAFITGFLLKEYSNNPYRSMNEEGHREAMTPDKLAEMI